MSKRMCVAYKQQAQVLCTFSLSLCISQDGSYIQVRYASVFDSFSTVSIPRLPIQKYHLYFFFNIEIKKFAQWGNLSCKYLKQLVVELTGKNLGFFLKCDCVISME